MPPSEERVALDAGIYVAGLMRELPPERHLGSTIVQFARERAFRLVVLDSVVNELVSIADREGTLQGIESRFLDLLIECDTEWEWRKQKPDGNTRRSILSRLRHLNDLPIALELAACTPDWFIHSNPEHWTGALDELLGTTVVTPREFLLAHGINPPPRLRR